MPQTWQLWLTLIGDRVDAVRQDKSIAPPQIADTDATDGSIYYSTDQNKLVFKDFSGVVNDLY